MGGRKESYIVAFLKAPSNVVGINMELDIEDNKPVLNFGRNDLYFCRKMLLEHMVQMP
jgi:hypothetical protein